MWYGFMIYADLELINEESSLGDLDKECTNLITPKKSIEKHIILKTDAISSQMYHFRSFSLYIRQILH